MGSGDDSATVRSSKQPPSTQETPTMPTYPDWSTPMQAYYGAGATPPFFASTIASSTNPHPYIWGSQHFIPPYGTPLPYPAIYPHGGLYSHPNMAMGAAPVTMEAEGKGPDEKEPVSMKKSKGSLGNIVGGKSTESGMVASGSGNDAASQSADSGSEDTSNSSEKNIDQQEEAKKRSFNRMIADGAHAQNGSVVVESYASAKGQSATNLPASMPGKPAANLNIGMDLWNASSAGAVPLKTRHNASGASPSVAPSTIVGHEGVVPEHLWIHDERELKRQKRKQSNRDSARRSRLRKQAECEKLQATVEKLSSENQSLKEELTKLSEECEKLSSANASIRGELEQYYGADAVSAFIADQGNTTPTRLVNGDGNTLKDRLKEKDSVSGENGNFLKSNGNLETNPN